MADKAQKVAKVTQVTEDAHATEGIEMSKKAAQIWKKKKAAAEGTDEVSLRTENTLQL